MPWFKFYADDFLNDTKMMNLNVVQKYLFIVLLCLAHREDKEGFVPFMENDDDLMYIARFGEGGDELKEGSGVLEKLERLKIIERKDGGVFLLNYKKRQGEYLTGYERVKKYREFRKVINDNVPDVINDNKKKLPMITEKSYHDVIIDNVRGDKSRVDKNRVYTHIAREKSRAKDSRKKRLDDPTPMTLDDFLAWCEKSPQRHINLIAAYADLKKPDYTTKGQWNAFIDRNVRPARLLSPYSDEHIQNAMEKLEKAQYVKKWTLETLGKFLEDGNSKVKEG